MSPTWLHDEDEAVALAAVDDVRRRCREHDGHDPLDEAAHLLLKHHGLAGLRPWVTADGFALRHGGGGADGDPAALDLAVAPEARGRGLGGTLAAAALAPPGAVTAWSHGDHPAARSIADREGLARVRELWVMRRPTDTPLPDAPPPAGVGLRTFEPAADVPALLAVNAAAFADHPEQGALDERGLAERMAEPWFDPSGLLLAVDEAGDVLGFHWTKQHNAAQGEVYVLGIAPRAQGRGLGRFLTVAGLRHLAERGSREVLLYVESDNGPALALYDGLGFTHAAADTHVQYLRRPAPPPLGIGDSLLDHWRGSSRPTDAEDEDDAGTEDAGTEDDVSEERLEEDVDEPASPTRRTPFHSKRGSDTLAPLSILAALGCAVAVGRMAVLETLREDIGLAIALSVACIALLAYALRASNSSRSVSIDDHGLLKVIQGDAASRFDLTSPATRLVVNGRPGETAWRVEVLRRGTAPVVIDSRTVNARTFMEALRQWRPDL